MVPVDGLVFHPGGTLASIALTGRMHLVTQFYPTDPCTPVDPCEVFLDLADVKGIRLPSGNSYVAIGAVILPFAGPTGPPITPTFIIMPVTSPGVPPIVPPSSIMPITRCGSRSTRPGICRPDGIVVQLPAAPPISANSRLYRSGPEAVSFDRVRTYNDKFLRGVGVLV